jgi:endothelin-converting enzyme/putative endopeptidase
MSPETKVKTCRKVDKITVKIGYPDKWKRLFGTYIKSRKKVELILIQNLSKWRHIKDLEDLKNQWQNSGRCHHKR